MHVDATLEVAAPVDRVVPHVADLSRYPAWMPLVHAVDVDISVADESAWIVELRAKVGVFARSKRLRMVRTEAGPIRFVFERDETDGRRHAAWTLTVDVESTERGSRVSVSLSYGGTLWTAGVLDKILAAQIEAGKEGLARIVAES